jgi:signal transduction histidine kinase
MDSNDLYRGDRSRLSATITATLAHDLQNLLTMMAGSLDVLRDSLPSGPDIDQTLSAIDRAIDGAFHIGREMLAMVQPNPTQESVVDVNEVVAEVRPLLAHILGDRVVLSLELAPSTAMVRADAVRLEWVLLNLASNAADAMPDGGRLTIAMRLLDLPSFPRDGDSPRIKPYLRLTVSDTGPGMSLDLRDKAFEPFFTTKPGRTGLGLTSAAITLGYLGGWLRLQSNSPQGARVEVYLPLVGVPDYGGR